MRERKFEQSKEKSQLKQNVNVKNETRKESTGKFQDIDTIDRTRTTVQRMNKSQNPDGLSHHTLTQAYSEFIVPPLKQDYSRVHACDMEM